MLSRPDNETLTRTGTGTPMGTLFRSYWIPVLLSEQVAERDGAPVRVKVLGEELIAFRDSAGRVALMEPRCPHRGANLFFGRNEEGGIRCAFHGWKFDARGECVDMPTIPPETMPRLCEKARIRACPTREWGGLVWAWMGDAQRVPELPQMEFALVPATHRHVSKKYQECNWAQAAEGGVDTAHFSFLHQPVASSDAELAEKAARATRGYSAKSMGEDHVRWMRDDTRPRYEVRKHDSGLVLGASRRAGAGSLYWRIAQYLLPSHAYTPSATEGQTYHGQTWIPIDDESCWVYLYSWNPTRPLTQEEIRSYRTGGAVYPEMDSNWMPIRNRGNDYLIDRRLQKTENFSGIVGVSEQDAAIQDSQGRIADRTRELLGPTDIGVVQFRRVMLEAARAATAGEVPLGQDKPEAYRVRAGGIVAPADAGFDDVMRLRFGDEVGRIAGSSQR
ncbi:Rieske 2Fe-2S domain-containing protein [Ramlibacter sp.]|uniref:Rieske 2Fe-2S domain-containing protein n=1 Tax=Ramlibacter sp. TaxID=1917967 RepID=UPI002607F06D|nr:Rieske 2Fe-2S domain-containing protein [Ramlibacter sp.]MDB5958374.1 ring-hydroxylating oxygenase subunit alpha [Ramlibacter sp.]